MFLSSLEIKNYRSLEHVKVDNLQQFNVFIGKNNAGKSSVFQALYDLNTANKKMSERFVIPPKRSKKSVETDKNDIAISPDILTDYDKNRSLEIFLEFKPTSQERRNFIKRFVVDGLDVTRQRAIENSLFLHKIQYSLKAAPGKPSPIYVREVRALTEDGKWAILVREEEDDQKTTLDQLFGPVYAIEDVGRKLLKAGSSENERRILLHTSNLTLADWGHEPPVDWLLRQANKYLSEAFFFNPFRHSTATVDAQQADMLDQDGANLAQVLHTLKTNNEEVFEEIEHFLHGALPDIGRLQTPLNRNQTNIVFRNAQQNYSTPLTSMGGGVEQLLMIASVLLMPHTQKSALFLEEPESHLHAGAQRYLIEKLYNSKRQVFISTHSPTFINLVKPFSLYQVKNAKGRTSTTYCDENALDDVLGDIGVRKSDVLMSDAVLFVEGPSDTEVLKKFSETLHKSFVEQNITILTMDGGRHAGRGAPIRNELLEDISRKAPVPHLFLLDRDERSDQEIQRLEKRLGEHLHIFAAREIENYLLIPSAILLALREKQRGDPGKLTVLDDTAEIEAKIAKIIQEKANDLYDIVLLKRIRAEIGGLRDGLLPGDAIKQLRPYVKAPSLATKILEEMKGQLEEHISSIAIEGIVKKEREKLDEQWKDSSLHLQLAPGEEILTEVFSAFGARYSKRSDADRIAKHTKDEDISGEIKDVIGKVLALTNSS